MNLLDISHNITVDVDVDYSVSPYTPLSIEINSQSDDDDSKRHDISGNKTMQNDISHFFLLFKAINSYLSLPFYRHGRRSFLVDIF